MDRWFEQIASMTDSEELIALKEQIKNEAMEKIPWQKRMDLYERVRLINERIEELRLKARP